MYAHELAAAGSDWGIAGLGMLDKDAEMQAALRAQDHLYTLIEKGAAEPTAEVIGSIIAFVHAPPGHDDAVAELVAAPETAIVSLTVTEGGYAEPTDAQLAAGPTPTFDRLAAGLALRRRRGLGPVTILSCDNLPGNGDAARGALVAAAATRRRHAGCVGRRALHVPELDGRPHHSDDRRARPPVAARVLPASTTAGRS